MADQKAGVHADAPLETVEELAEALPTPLHSLLEGLERHALDLGHHPAGEVGVGVLERSQGEPAVAADDGGHAVVARRRGVAVPVQLGVVVGVRVDETRSDDLAGGIDGLGGRFVHLADGDDAVPPDAHVGFPGRGPGAVHYRSTFDQVIEDDGPPVLCARVNG